MPATPDQITAPLGRRTLLKGLGFGGAAVAVSGLTACSSPTPEPAPSASGSSTTPTASPSATEPSGQIDAAGVERGLAALPAIIEKYVKKTGIPGLAMAVVYEGKVRFIEGFGVREEGKPDKIDADTVFSLASVSKPISSTVIGAALTKKVAKVGWNDPIQQTLTDFTLSDRWVGSHVTPADMFGHRSGLPDHAGNLLEDLGYSRAQITERLRYYPLFPFRDHYDYTNYGLTAGAEAIAKSAGTSWESLAQEMIFKPLGMTSSSYAYADLARRTNRAALHRKVDGAWVPTLATEDYDEQAPAGSASASVRDLTKWATMLLAKGSPVMSEDELKTIWRPATVKPGLPEIGKAASFYGYGWNINYEPTGELRASHSGAFARGAATSVTFYPSKGLAIIGLTNAEPMAVPEAISVEFADVIRYGKSTQEDWQAVIAPFVTFKQTEDDKKYRKQPTDPAKAKPLGDYLGRYRNDLYGAMTVTEKGGSLSFAVGPKHTFALQHYSGDDFFFRTIGEDDSGFSGAIFKTRGGKIVSVTVNAWNADDLGTFTKA